MIVLDSSALFAIIANEPERQQFSQSLSTAASLAIGAPTLVELRIAVQRRFGDEGISATNELVDAMAMAVLPLDREAANIAHLAFLRYGKTRHPAGLNFGDCMAYAIAKFHGAPLLFKGDDFRQTDIAAAA